MALMSLKRRGSEWDVLARVQDFHPRERETARTVHIIARANFAERMAAAGKRRFAHIFR